MNTEASKELKAIDKALGVLHNRTKTAKHNSAIAELKQAYFLLNKLRAVIEFEHNYSLTVNN